MATVIALNTPTTTPTTYEPTPIEYWSVNGTSIDTSGDEVLRAKESDNRHHLTYLHINCVVNATIEIADEGGVLLGPFKFLAAGPTNIRLRFERPIQFTTNQNISVNHGGVVCNVYIEGFTTPA